MITQSQKGRAQVRQGRIARKAKRGKFNVYSRPRQRFVEEGLGAKVRAAIGDDTLRCVDGRLSVQSDDVVVQSSKTGAFVTEYRTARSFLQVRLLPDDKGRIGDARNRLLEMAEKFDFGCRAADGPTAVEDLDTNMVEIRLKAIPTADCAMRRELLVAGFTQAQTQERLFVCRSSRQAIVFAVHFCERHSGEWFTLSRVPQRSVDCLFRASWCELHERSRQLPGNGTTEHLLAAHPYRKPKHRSKSDGISGVEVVASRRNNNGITLIPPLRKAGANYVSTARQYENGCGPRARQFASHSFGDRGKLLPFGC